MKYVELDLDQRLAQAIQNLGYSEQTPIQEQSFTHIVSGKDVAGLAQTGTGKTAAFLIPLMERILKAETHPDHERAFKDWKAFNSILILVPTRELAEQIHENIQKLGEGTGLKSFPLYGGTGYDKQKEALASNLQFIVSTPGRLIDLYKDHVVDFKKVKAIVFDEADRMFDMGFKDDMTYILSRIERTRQLLVFSATLNFDVLNTAYHFGSEPVEINISKDVAKADNVQDFLFHVGQDEKPMHLLSVLNREKPEQTIIFTNFKNNVDRLAQFLTSNQLPAMGISSLMSQNQRNHVMSKFKETNNQNILVATDVAARGLDISNVDLVINYELPQDAESYVHRIGRTGRAGKLGKAISFASDKDIESLSRIEEYTKKKIEIDFLEDQFLVKEFNALQNSEPRFKKPFGDRNDRAGRSGRGGSGGDREQKRHSRSDRSRDERRSKPFSKDSSQAPAGASAAPNVQTGSVNASQFKGSRSEKFDRKNNQKNQAASSHHQARSQNSAQATSQNASQGQGASKNANVRFSKNTSAKPNFSSSRRQNAPQGVLGTVKNFFKKLFG